jgi:hypothetical protein
MSHGKPLALVAVLTAALHGFAAPGAMVRKEMPCPHEALESCRWEIRAERQGESVQIRWDKSIVSRHREKPMARPIRCNVDRDFDMAAGGYVRVWFRGENAPCDPLRQDPAECGVTFLLDAPPALASAQGVKVTAPAGKVLDRVEHLSTLNLQCGDFRRRDFARAKWHSRVGWRADRPGDGTYQESSAAR